MPAWTQSAEVAFPADHPTAAGHFPGDPIVPGAVLLDEVLAALALESGKVDIRWVKFLRPVRPGDRLTIRWERQANGETRFAGMLGDPERVALTGLVRAADHG